MMNPAPTRSVKIPATLIVILIDLYSEELEKDFTYASHSFKSMTGWWIVFSLSRRVGQLQLASQQLTLQLANLYMPSIHSSLYRNEVINFVSTCL